MLLTLSRGTAIKINANRLYLNLGLTDIVFFFFYKLTEHIIDRAEKI